MQIALPGKVRQIVEALEDHGYEGFAVGGCVRDSCLGRTPHDWDITTSASPQQVKGIFSHTFDTGIAHGTVTVLIGGEGFEVTTYRVDGPYEDGRHPKNVTFTACLDEDLRRRDFTINAMACNDRVGIVDLFEGREDLERKVIRCVGDPMERFSEDALRILRAVRFGAQLGFEIEPQTAEAARELAGTLKKISAERIREELGKLITSDRPEDLRIAYELGITAIVLPEFDAIMKQPQNSAHHIYDAGMHTLVAMQNIEADPVLRWTMLFHDMGKPEVVTEDEAGKLHFKKHAEASAVIAKKIMKRLKFDNATMNAVVRLVRCHSLYPKESEESVRRAVFEIGPDLFPLYLKVKRADIMGQNPEVHQVKFEYLDRIQATYERIIQRGDCLSLKQLAVTGGDLIADGVPAGRGMGDLLAQLLDEVLTDPQRNDRDWLLERSRQLRNS